MAVNSGVRNAVAAVIYKVNPLSPKLDDIVHVLGVYKTEWQEVGQPLVWDCLKGRIEGGESPLEAAIREAKEKLGIPDAAYKKRVDTSVTLERATPKGRVQDDVFSREMITYVGLELSQPAEPDLSEGSLAGAEWHRLAEFAPMVREETRNGFLQAVKKLQDDGHIYRVRSLDQTALRQTVYTAVYRSAGRNNGIEMLLIHKDYWKEGDLDFPGGGIEDYDRRSTPAFESVRSFAARRELRRELGIPDEDMEKPEFTGIRITAPFNSESGQAHHGKRFAGKDVFYMAAMYLREKGDDRFAPIQRKIKDGKVTETGITELRWVHETRLPDAIRLQSREAAIGIIKYLHTKGYSSLRP